MNTVFHTLQSIQQSTRFSCLCLTLLLVAGVCVPTDASESFTVTTDLYQGFDLATGMTELDPTVITIIIGSGQEIETISAPSIDPLFEFSPLADLFFGFNTDADLPVSVFAEQINGMAVIRETAFDAVTGNMLLQLELDADIQAITIDSDDLIVLLTIDDDYVVLGDVMLLPDAQVQFTYRTTSDSTDPVPEPGTLLLLGAGIVGLLGITQRKRQSSQGETRMKYGKVLLLVLVLVSLLIGTATAAELRVMTLGTGNGLVMGGEIFCGSDCKETYEEGAVVHLKAIPKKDSTFVGWLVNGEPHEGVITIEEDTVVTAIFDLKSGSRDELAVVWYEGNRKEEATMVLDEVVILFELWRKLGVTTREEYDEVVSAIIPVYHPQAMIIHQDEVGMTLKRPEPIPKEQLPALLAILKENKYIKQVSPIFYHIPGISESWTAPTGEILVQYPPGYTAERIQAIETEYELPQTKLAERLPNLFVYQIDDILQVFDIANRLYESGQAEFSYPNMLRSISFKGYPDDPLFKYQWNLQDVNLLSAWLHGYTGSPDEVIAIVDSGVYTTHEDLAANLLEGKSYDFIDREDDPSPGTWFPTGHDVHGTRVAGVAVARGYNNQGIIGTAPLSKFVAYRMKGFYDDHLTQARALTTNNDLVDIYNSSWGPPDTGVLFRMPSIIESYMEEFGVGKNGGRGGLGNIYVMAGGDGGLVGDYSNYDGYANSRYTIPVAASGDGGGEVGYSERGANILVNAPAGGLSASGNPITLVTTAVSLFGYDYYDDEWLGGTSAAAPLVSGIIALMLQAKPKLTWRDIQHILIKTTDKNDPNDGDWIDNKAGYHFNHKYGAGRINAYAAVEAASLWTPTLNPEKYMEPLIKKSSLDSTIPIEENIQIEFIEVLFDSEYSPWNKLGVKLTSPSPSPTESVLAEPHDLSGDEYTIGAENGYNGWSFGSVRHFGEYSKGDWTLSVIDNTTGNPMNFPWQIKIYGTELPAWSLETLETSTCSQEGGGVICWFPDGQGSVGLVPLDVEREDLQYAFLDLPEDPDQEPDWEIRHAGTYWFPARRDDQDRSPKLTVAFNLNVRKWLAELFQPDSTTLPCDEDPPDIEEEVHDIGVLEMEEIVVDETHRRCRVTLQIGAHPVLRAEFQSVVACDEVLFLPDLPSDTLTARVTSQWEAGQRDDQAPNWVPAGSESRSDTKTTGWGSTHQRREYYLEGLLGTAFLVKAKERCNSQDPDRWYHSMWPNQITPPIPPAVNCPASPSVRSSGSSSIVTSCIASVSGGGVPTLEERAISAVPREAWCSYIKDYRFFGKCYGLWEYYAADPHICEDGTLTEIKARRFTYEVTTTDVTWQPMGQSCQQTYLRTPTEIVLDTPLPQFLALFDMERATHGGDDSATTFPPDLDPGSDDDGGPEPDPDEEPQ